MAHALCMLNNQGNTQTQNIQSFPLASEPGIYLIILSLISILKRNLKRTTDIFLSISHTKSVLLFKFRCNIFIGVRIIKEMPGSVASGTLCMMLIIFSIVTMVARRRLNITFICTLAVFFNKFLNGKFE